MGRQKKSSVPKPIVRKPIKLNSHMKKMLLLWEESEKTKHHDIVSIGMYYSMLVRQVKNSTGFRALPENNPESHKNWKHFEMVYEICSIKEWDYKLYLKAQFHRAKYFTNSKLSYPFASMLYSVAALKYYATYSLDIEQKHEKDTKSSIKEIEEYQSLHEEIESGIIKTAKTIANHLSRLDPSIDKASYKQIAILHGWREFSPYYLYTVPWITNLLEADDSKKAKKYLEKFELLDDNVPLQQHVWKVLDEVEKRLNIPENIHL